MVVISILGDMAMDSVLLPHQDDKTVSTCLTRPVYQSRTQGRRIAKIPLIDGESRPRAQTSILFQLAK